jgi:hypothetical protein
MSTVSFVTLGRSHRFATSGYGAQLMIRTQSTCRLTVRAGAALIQDYLEHAK